MKRKILKYVVIWSQAIKELPLGPLPNRFFEQLVDWYNPY